jgi:glutaredoxin/glutathione-dependent peroxiredoxin
MPISVGDHLPQATFRISTPDGPAARTTDDLFHGRKVVLVAVPGAFTPTCDRNHLPGYVQHAAALKAAGVDAILVTSTNDVFVLKAWSASAGADGVVEMLSDGNADFAKALGLSFDGTGFGMGIRSQRYSMLVEDGVVKSINIEDGPGKADLSGADTMLRQLKEAGGAA